MHHFNFIMRKKIRPSSKFHPDVLWGSQCSLGPWIYSGMARWDKKMGKYWERGIRNVMDREGTKNG